MIVTCPECSSQYLLPDEAVGQGRRVKCVGCAHIWVQTSSQDPEHAGSLSFDSYELDDTSNSFSTVVEPDAGLLADMRDASHPIVVRRQTGGIIAKALAVAAILLFLTAGLAVILRQGLVETWPPAALIFEKLHLPVQPRGQGLALSSVKFLAGRNEAEDTSLKVSGNITNQTKHRLVLPDLIVTQRGGGDLVKKWPIGLRGKTIAPGQVLSFNYELKHALSDMTQANLGFSD